VAFENGGPPALIFPTGLKKTMVRNCGTIWVHKQGWLFVKCCRTQQWQDAG